GAPAAAQVEDFLAVFQARPLANQAQGLLFGAIETVHPRRPVAGAVLQPAAEHETEELHGDLVVLGVGGRRLDRDRSGFELSYQRRPPRSADQGLLAVALGQEPPQAEAHEAAQGAVVQLTRPEALGIEE